MCKIEHVAVLQGSMYYKGGSAPVKARTDIKRPDYSHVENSPPLNSVQREFLLAESKTDGVMGHANSSSNN